MEAPEPIIEEFRSKRYSSEYSSPRAEMVEYLNNQSGGCTEATPVPQLRESCRKEKPDTADYLGDSDELDEFAVHHSSDENLTNKEVDIYMNEILGDEDPVCIVDD